MRDDIPDDIGVIDDIEVKPPAAVDSGLPKVFGFVILFRVQGRMAKILEQEPELLEKGLAHIGWGIFQSFEGTRNIVDFHRARLRCFLAARFLSSFSMEEIMSSAVLKGP